MDKALLSIIKDQRRSLLADPGYASDPAVVRSLSSCDTEDYVYRLASKALAGLESKGVSRPDDGEIGDFVRYLHLQSCLIDDKVGRKNG